MVRFRVVRASRVLLVAAAVLLAAVLGLLAYRIFTSGEGPTAMTEANLVEAIDGGAKTEGVFASSGGAFVPYDPDSGEAIRIEVLPGATAAPIRPSVLIYHTHTHEAYEQVSDDPYQALEAWRTTDADHSVVRVGSELAKRLEARGLEVVHDTTDCEGGDLSTAYTRSLDMLKKYSRRFDLYIDLHRDAWSEGMDRAFIAADGTQTAQLMILIGNGNGFDEKPWYRQNYAFAQALADRINEAEPGLCKPVLVKDGRYNQHIGVFSILVEVGHNKNTLREALNAMPALSDGICSLLIEHPDQELQRMKDEYDAGF